MGSQGFLAAVILALVLGDSPVVLSKTSRRTTLVRSSSPSSSPRMMSSLSCGRIKLASDDDGDLAVANVGDLPWMAELEISYGNPNASNVCAGILLSDQWLLTAAHCFSQDDAFKLATVHFGTTDFGQPPPNAKSVKATTVTLNYHFDNLLPYKSDFALVQLDEPIEFTDTISPICLPSHCDTNCDKVIAIGWAASLDSENDVLNKVPFNLATDCQVQVDDEETENMICGQPQQLNVLGSSSGPIVCVKDGFASVIGVISTASDETSIITAGNVCRFATWITSLTGISFPKVPSTTKSSKATSKAFRTTKRNPTLTTVSEGEEIPTSTKSISKGTTKTTQRNTNKTVKPTTTTTTMPPTSEPATTEGDEICQLRSDQGDCSPNRGGAGAHPLAEAKYFYNADVKLCQTFMYCGSKGNANRFDDAASCQAKCGDQTDFTITPGTLGDTETPENN